MYGCKSWTIKKAERWRIDAFELWCWRRLMRVPWTAWRSSQYILKEISPGCSLEHWCWSWNSNNLKRPWSWEWFRAGGEGDDRGWDGWMASPTQWTWVWVSSGRWWGTWKSVLLQSTGSQRVREDFGTKQQQCALPKVCYSQYSNWDSVVSSQMKGSSPFWGYNFGGMKTLLAFETLSVEQTFQDSSGCREPQIAWITAYIAFQLLLLHWDH